MRASGATAGASGDELPEGEEATSAGGGAGDTVAAMDSSLDDAVGRARRALTAAGIDAEPTGVYLGNFGPALMLRLGDRFDIVFGPDSPLADKRIEAIFASWALSPHVLGELVAALDALAGVVCRPPRALEVADEYLAEVKRTYALLPATL